MICAASDCTMLLRHCMSSPGDLKVVGMMTVVSVALYFGFSAIGFGLNVVYVIIPTIVRR